VAGAELNSGFDTSFTIAYRSYDLQRRLGAKDWKFVTDVVWNLLESEGEFCCSSVDIVYTLGFVPVEACRTLCEEVVSKYFHFVFSASSASSMRRSRCQHGSPGTRLLISLACHTDPSFPSPSPQPSNRGRSTSRQANPVSTLHSRSPYSPPVVIVAHEPLPRWSGPSLQFGAIPLISRIIQISPCKASQIGNICYGCF